MKEGYQKKSSKIGDSWEIEKEEQLEKKPFLVHLQARLFSSEVLQFPLLCPGKTMMFRLDVLTIKRK